MKKIISLLLVLWLPLFFSAAGHAATTMQAHENMAFSKAGAEQMQQAQMPEHCKMAMGGFSNEAPDLHGNPDHTSQNSCQHCGFCVSLGFFMLPAFAVQHPHHPLIGHAGWVSSPHTTQAILRPPITAV